MYTKQYIKDEHTLRYWRQNPDGTHTDVQQSGSKDWCEGEAVLLRCAGIAGIEIYACGLETYKRFGPEDWQKKEQLQSYSYYDRRALSRVLLGSKTPHKP